MTSSGFTHHSVQKRSIRIHLFNILAWVLGGVIGIGGFALTENLWALLAIPAGLFIGLPVPDVGSPHAWVIKEWRSRSQYRRDNGVLLHAPLSERPGDKPSKIGQVELVMARVTKGEGKETFLPLLTTTDRRYVTMCLEIGGASKLWLGGDADVKYNWDLDWLDAVARALSTTKEEELIFGQGRTHRPANKEPGLAYNRSRGDQRALAAAGSKGTDTDYSQAEIGIGQNLIAGFEQAYAVGGEPTNYCYIRMPWPTRFGRKISLDDAEAFRASALFKTIGKTLEAYRHMDVEVSFVDLRAMRTFWDEFWHLSDLDRVRMYRKRDEELPQAPQGSEAPQAELNKPISIRASKPGEPGFINYGGSYHAAGYATKITRPKLRPGFQESVLVLSDDTYYTFTTCIEAPLVTGEAHKAREKERLFDALKGANPLTKHLSNPEEDIRYREVLERRVRLAEGSQRAANFHALASVVASSPAELDARWDDMVAQMAGVYTFTRADQRDDIEDILLAQLGVFVD